MSRRWSQMAAAMCSLLLLMGWARAVWCAGPRVAYVAGADESDDSETALLLRAELRAAGFLVVHVARKQPGRDTLEEAARGTGSVAAVQVQETESALTAEVWLIERSSGEGVRREVSARARGSEGARLLALRVAELLHANAMALGLSDEPSAAPAGDDAGGGPERPSQAAAPASSASTDTKLEAEADAAPLDDESRESSPSSWAIGVGPAVLAGPGGTPVSLAPLALLSWRASHSWSAELVIVGPAISTIDDRTGSATVDQELALARARVTSPGQRFSPHLSMGAGLYRIGASGEAREPYVARSVQQWAALAALGLGLRWHASRAVNLLGELNGAFIGPRPALRFDGRTAAAVPAPLVLGVIALELQW